MLAHQAVALLCPECRSELSRQSSELICAGCGGRFPCEEGIADLARGRYYDRFDEETAVPSTLAAGLHLEEGGVERRIRGFYAPRLRNVESDVRTVLDCGCGNGLSVDLLAEEGFESWGVDISQLRKWQWKSRQRRDRLVVTDGASLPFADAVFDAVISSGVIEHVGVDEMPSPAYSAKPRVDRDLARRGFLGELLRTVRPGGVVFVDCPNGAFPIDFWHGNRPGEARRHSLSEGFLPRFAEIAALVRELAPEALVEALSPFGRLQFHQSRGHTHGRWLAGPAAAYLRLMTLPGFRWLARTGFNPFLVVRIVRP